MPGPLSMIADHHAIRCAARRHLDPAGIGSRVEGIVDQIGPDLVEFAGEAVDGRKAGFDIHDDFDRSRTRL